MVSLKDNMDLIEANWDKIIDSLKITLNLFSSFGYSYSNLSSYGPVLSVALYVYIKDIDMKIINSKYYEEDRKLIKEWIIKSTLKRIFSGTDNVSKPIRDIFFNNTLEIFPLKEIKEKLKSIPTRSINFSSEEIDTLLEYQYGNTHIFSILQLLYPDLNYQNIFHIDHIYPKSKFNKKYVENLGLDLNILYKYNYLSNLQLLEGQHNIEKSNKEFDIWLNELNLSKDQLNDYCRRNYIPQDIEYTFENYNEFMLKRDKLIKNKLSDILK